MPRPGLRSSPPRSAASTRCLVAGAAWRGRISGGAARSVSMAKARLARPGPGCRGGIS